MGAHPATTAHPLTPRPASTLPPTALCGAQIASRGENMVIHIDYRKDASKGYPKPKGACSIM